MSHPLAFRHAGALMKRVLFVDDDESILASLRDVMRRQRRKWDMSFAVGAKAALEACREKPFDIVVTDLHMPMTDGAALLEQVQADFPDSVRIVLSGSTNPEAALPVVKAAHLFLAKPCDPDTLEAAIDRTLSLRSMIADPRLRAMVGRVGSLPAEPAALAVLLERLRDPDVSAAEIAAVLEGDMAMSAKLLQITNSAFFGLPRQVSNVTDAVKYLGHGLIRDLALATSVFSAETSARPEWTAALQQHALLAGTIARKIAPEAVADEAFLAGMLHDVGLLVLATRLPEEFERLTASLRARPRPLAEAEAELWEVGHGQIGAYLLSLWGLPQTIVEAVAYHDRPADVTTRGLEIVGVVYLADQLAQEVESRPCGISGVRSAGLDAGVVSALGVEGALEGWRDQVRSLALARAG